MVMSCNLTPVRPVMNTKTFATIMIIAAALALAGCAVSPEEEKKRQEMEADIDDILGQQLDPLEYGEPTSCLRDNEVRSYRALGTRHLLFEGRQGKLWVNTLRGRCATLDRNSVFITRPNVAGRLCDMDRFDVVPRGTVGTPAAAGSTCVLGEFKPVTEAQVQEVENRLSMR